MLDWLEGLPLSVWVAESELGYPFLLSAHSIGMAGVVGLLLMLDIRVLGVAKAIPIGAFRQLMPVAWAGFGLNLISGVLLFNATAHRLLINWPFIAKMSAIVVAGAVTWLLWRRIGRDDTPARGAKALAGISIALWLAAIVFGRLIAYVMDYMILNGGA